MVDGDELLFIIARARQQRNGLKGSVVGTLMSNLGLEHAVRTLGLDFKRAKVGDRYILEMLQKGGWTLGGESSGHLVCLDLTTTGDGIVSALQVLEAMLTADLPLKDLKSGMRKYPQKLVNIRMHRPSDVCGIPAVKEAVKSAEAELSDTGRVLLRPSGTEPLVRVMVEGVDAAQVDRIAHRIADAVEGALKAAA